MQVRRSLLYETMGDKTAQKAVSLLMLLKKRLDKTSSLHDASYNKIAAILNISPTTVKKYIAIWEEYDLIEWRGKNHNVFVVKKLSSSTKHRNLDVHRLDFSSFKNLYNTLRSFLFLVANSRKDYVKRLIRIVNNPRKGEDFKEAIKGCKKYADRRPNEKGFVYKEFGLSYKRIGKILGFCSRTAENIVNLALQKHWCKKERHFDWDFLPGVNRMYVEGYTFTTTNYGFKVSANTYANSRGWGMALIGGKK